MSDVLESLHPTLRELPGKTIMERYRIDEALGVGGMGAVFRGRHLGLKRDVAIKVLHPDLTRDPEISKRFDREAHSASRLDHPNCLRVTDVGTTDEGVKFMVMDLLAGSELADRLGRSLPADQAVLMMMQVLRGLEHAHDNGVVHRDIKPENIFITKDHDNHEVLKLVDFGIAKLAGGGANDDTRMTKAGLIFGTPAYMSPEQAMGMEADARADLYSVGVILYEMLVGTPPFESDDPVKLVRMQVSRDPPPLPEHVHPSLAAVVMKLLAKDREERYQSATETREALEAVLPLVATSDVISVMTMYGSRHSGPIAVGSPVTGSFPLIPGAVVSAASSSVSAPISVSMPVPREPPSGIFSPATLPTLPPGSTVLQPRSKRRIPPLAIGGVAVVLALGIWAVGRGGESESEGGGGGGTPSVEGESSPSGENDDDGDDGGLLSLVDGPDDQRLAEIDRLILSDKLPDAQALLKPLLDEYPDNAMLAWRQGRILVKGKKRKNKPKALAAYGDAVDSDSRLLQDTDFYAELHALLIDDSLRTEALDFALRKMGSSGHKFLLELINNEKKSLGYNDRRRVLQELSTVEENDALVDWKLHRVLDVGQAKDALTPCTAYRDALDNIALLPEYDFLPKVQKSEVPKPRTGEGLTDEEKADAAKCEGLEARRAEVIAMLEALAPVEDTDGDLVIIDDDGGGSGGQTTAKKPGGSKPKPSGSKPSGSKSSGCNKPFGWVNKKCR
ncbi:serine/threonine protein kinase [Paraliomyxa miuraensis]|uniref:serine/threonine protein kinase n=1 Tax=Paraliomyxa miuraensis TaxID=376150 RepID=UPI00225125BE|nr:serine/threonine-protein kinase [Paraliomyxa miuraensis]MCX4247943.1 serine/threonine protein kinase [Paraliomyxa miuraensis]